jgi:hypothetical protein
MESVNTTPKQSSQENPMPIINQWIESCEKMSQRLRENNQDNESSYYEGRLTALLDVKNLIENNDPKLLTNKPKENPTPAHLQKLLEQIDHLALLTSGQCLVFDKEDQQIVDLQLMFANGETNPYLLKQMALHAKKFTIGKFREWTHELTQTEFMKIANLL